MSQYRIDQSHPESQVFHGIEDFSSEIGQEKQKPISKGLSLHQVFHTDTIEENVNMPPSSIQTNEIDSSSLSFWKRFLNWWSQPVFTPSISNVENEGKKTQPPQAINSIPKLDQPDAIPSELQGINFPHNPQNYALKKVLASSDIVEGLTKMSEQTLEAILFIIYNAQLELEKDGAQAAEKTYSKYLDFQNVQQEMLNEIKDVLAKDEQVSKYFQTAQNVTFAASFVTGIAAAAMSFGLLAPVGAYIGSTLGGAAAATFMSVASAIGTTGPFVSAGLTALTVGSNTYFKNRFNEDRAKHEIYQHSEKHYNYLLEDWNQRLMSTAQANNASQEAPFRHLRRQNKMRKIILKK